MIYAETRRLILRSLEQSDLPHMVERIGEWDVTRWLISVPYPYTMQHAEEYHRKMTEAHHKGEPEFFLLHLKETSEPVGAVGLHPPLVPDPQPGELVTGYWLAKPFWGKGLMSEAVTPVLTHAFARPTTIRITATADPANTASQNILRKTGFSNLGTFPRRETTALRGSNIVTHWELLRETYKA